MSVSGGLDILAGVSDGSGHDGAVWRGVLGALLGAVAAAGIAAATNRVGMVGGVLLAGLGSLLGWGVENLFERHRARVAGVMVVVALLGIAAVFAFPIDQPPNRSDGGTTPAPSDDAPLVIPDRSMSFTAMVAAAAPDDLDGLIAIARSTYGDPQRLTIRHMTYDSAPDSSALTVSVAAFTGSTARALAEVEWEWFAAGNSGDRHTEPKTWGEVRCALHDQENGTGHAECWRWDDRLVVTVHALAYPTGSERNLAPAVEDLFVQTAKSY